jgi:hypothetical protein
MALVMCRGHAYSRRQGTRRRRQASRDPPGLGSRQDSSPPLKYATPASTHNTQGIRHSTEQPAAVINIPDSTGHPPAGAPPPGVPLVSRALSSVPGQLSVLPLPPRQLMRAEGLQGSGLQGQGDSSASGTHPVISIPTPTTWGAPLTTGSPVLVEQQSGLGLQRGHALAAGGAEVSSTELTEQTGALPATVAAAAPYAAQQEPLRKAHLPAALHPALGHLPPIHSPATQSQSSLRSPFASQAQLSIAEEEAAGTPAAETAGVQAQAAPSQQPAQQGLASPVTRAPRSTSPSSSSPGSQQPTTPRASRQNSASPLIDSTLPTSSDHPPHASAAAAAAKGSSTPGAAGVVAADPGEHQPLLQAVPTLLHNRAQLHTPGITSSSLSKAASGTTPPAALLQSGRAQGQVSGSGVAPGVLAARLESLLSSALVEPVTFPATEEGFIAQVGGPVAVLVQEMRAHT